MENAKMFSKDNTVLQARAHEFPLRGLGVGGVGLILALDKNHNRKL